MSYTKFVPYPIIYLIIRRTNHFNRVWLIKSILFTHLPFCSFSLEKNIFYHIIYLLLFFFSIKMEVINFVFNLNLKRLGEYLFIR